jgi:hypothetical protein
VGKGISRSADDVPTTFEIPWDASKVIQQIYVNPYAEGWYFEAVKAALARFVPALASSLQLSDLGGDPWSDD